MNPLTLSGNGRTLVRLPGPDGRCWVDPARVAVVREDYSPDGGPPTCAINGFARVHAGLDGSRGGVPDGYRLGRYMADEGGRVPAPEAVRAAIAALPFPESP